MPEWRQSTGAAGRGMKDVSDETARGNTLSSSQSRWWLPEADVGKYGRRPELHSFFRTPFLWGKSRTPRNRRRLGPGLPAIPCDRTGPADSRPGSECDGC